MSKKKLKNYTSSLLTSRWVYDSKVIKIKISLFIKVEVMDVSFPIKLREGLIKKF
jgi:hypothetical protein